LNEFKNKKDSKDHNAYASWTFCRDIGLLQVHCQLLYKDKMSSFQDCELNY
jgi:hypothetical protein